MVPRRITTENFASDGSFLSLDRQTYTEHCANDDNHPVTSNIKGNEMYIDTSIHGMFGPATSWEHAECQNMLNITRILDTTTVISTP